MKKLFLSIAVVSAITMGVGAIASATETNGNSVNYEEATVSETSTDTEENTIVGRGNCPYYNEENRGVGNPDCPYYEEHHNGDNQGLGQGNRYGYNSEKQGNGSCNGSGQRMMRNRFK